MKNYLLLALVFLPCLQSCSNSPTKESPFYGAALVVFTPDRPETWQIDPHGEMELDPRVDDYFYTKKECRKVTSKYIAKDLSGYNKKDIKERMISENLFRTNFVKVVYCYPQDFNKGYFWPYDDGKNINGANYKQYPLFTDDPKIKKYYPPKFVPSNK